MDEALAGESLKASSVKDSSSSFFCHHLLPSAPCLVFLSPFSSLIHCQERLPLKGQFCTVLHRERRRATDAITVSDLKQEAIIRSDLSTCAFGCSCASPELPALMPSVCEVPSQGHGLICCNKWHFLGVGYKSILPTNPGAVLFAFCLSHVYDICAWAMPAENEAVAFVMAGEDGVWWRHQPHLATAFSKWVIRHLCGSKKENSGMEVHARYSVLLCSSS